MIGAARSGSVQSSRPGIARQAVSNAASYRSSRSVPDGRTTSTEKIPASCRKTITWYPSGSACQASGFVIGSGAPASCSRYCLLT